MSSTQSPPSETSHDTFNARRGWPFARRVVSRSRTVWCWEWLRDHLRRSADAVIFAVTNARVYSRHPRHIVSFKRSVGYLPNVARPLRYNEMMLWRKVFDHNPAFITFSDKLATKDYVCARCPDLPLAEVLWTGTDAADIPQWCLAQSFMIKSNHGSGQNRVVAPGDAVPVDMLNAWLDHAYGQNLLEWAYSCVPRTLLAEALLAADDGQEVMDLCVHTLDGSPLFLEAIMDNKTNEARKAYFRPDGSRWRQLERKSTARPSLPLGFLLPGCYRQALDHARALGTGVDYVRIDFMIASGVLYGGEITVYPGSGLTPQAEFADYNAVMARTWDLTQSWFLRTTHDGWLGPYGRALQRFLDRRGPQR